MVVAGQKNKRREKGDGGLYVDSKGLHVAYVYVTDKNGERRQIRRASKDETVAKRKLRDLLVDVANGKINTPKEDQYTVAEWLKKWIEDIRKGDVKPKTERDYRSTINNYIVPFIGSVKLEKLTTDHVRKMIRANQARETDDGRKATRSAQKAYVLLNRAVKDAIKEEVLTKNVVALVKKPNHNAKERTAYSDGTAKSLLQKAVEIDEGRKDGPWLATRWMFAFRSGQRQAECLGLEWDRVFLDDGVVDMSWQLQSHTKIHGCGEQYPNGAWPCGKGGPAWCPLARWDFPADFEYRECHRSLVWARPKSVKSEHFIPLTPMMKEALMWHKWETDGINNPHNLVWHHPDGRPISQKDDNRYWNELIAACGITKQRGELLLHEARNTTATQLMEEGTDPKVIQELLGHVHILTTRQYQKVRLDFAKQAVAVLDRV
ncbi:tyrosine-type recombinase/integrase [Mycobacteroides abscessus]|uniref:tyrosine-type recombinase/integrase n=1 Tax=Mycobacteroides abscessus TaxID=36809 RepID=UPI0009A62CA3|nr:site-specific integrase [Mycobacteroides abscessus]SKT46766.1 integrase [Mycobacteroides abscessus subsp. bolletii]